MLACLCPLYPQDGFQGLLQGYVPDGRAHKRTSLVNSDKCQEACAKDPRCKAFAFRTTRPSCYFYTRVYMGGSKVNRKMGIYSSGLSVVPKHGFVSAFKTSSYPSPPRMEEVPR